MARRREAVPTDSKVAFGGSLAFLGGLLMKTIMVRDKTAEAHTHRTNSLC